MMSITSPLASLFGLAPASAAMLAVFLAVGLLTALIAGAKFQPLLAFVAAAMAAAFLLPPPSCWACRARRFRNRSKKASAICSVRSR
jgi:Flp pilus assembly protein TadB